MNAKELRNLIDSLAYDIEFDYRGVHGSICPINRNDIGLAYGEQTEDCNSIDEAMGSKLFDGKSLNEIATELDMY
jgi:hypothetical protein